MTHTKMKFYFGEGTFGYRKLFVATGEFRPPKKGERYLSGAIPCAYVAPNNLSIAYPIAREATDEETHCKHCGQRLELNIIK